ncbi:hypothetical protein BO71DRAFT_427390 [Aspergillus ellipticus CBS 707.79]|uniref:Uncharacterized protein n=1 Tax=Aspergillus ellipticus CBS 707.79 TaxID=1448320 RepID=A0A319EYY4_9EURO|nr:hypothetical protein BO71DRAFT_427390 [Aspergillus ellipticus CBS 707.79]
MSITTTTPLTFYDIATRPPAETNCCSPNTWKSRFALNYKHAPYSTVWVPLLDVTKVRKSLHVPACRKFADGSDFYTLPILHDRGTTTEGGTGPGTGTLVGDSFDIAVHLQETYPDAGPAGSTGDNDLFPPQTLDYTFGNHDIVVPLTGVRDRREKYAPYAQFNVHVDAVFSAHVQLTVQGFRFDPATEDAVKAQFVSRAGVASWEDFKLEGEAREKTVEAFREALGELARLFRRDPAGPFVLGQRPSYADFIVGGWLRMMDAMLPSGEWEGLKAWHDGVFGRLHNALEVYTDMKTV